MSNQISNATDKNGIIQLCESLCLLGDASISGNATLLAQFLNYINMGIGEVRSGLLNVDSSFKSDDFNYTDYPDAPITLVLGQSDYTLPVSVVGGDPSSLLKINGVYFVSNGDRTYLDLMGEGDELSTTRGQATKYKLNGKSIFLQNPPDAATISKYTSLHIEFQRLDSPMTSSNLTRYPGFTGTYHHILALYASSWYYRPINPNLADYYMSGRHGFETLLEQLKSDYAWMNDGNPRRMAPNTDNNR